MNATELNTNGVKLKENNYKKEDGFFIIDSKNIETIETKLYGYCIEGDRILREVNDESNIDSVDGAFVYIKREENKIIIKQDFAGFYGLYIFKKGKYFAISNSFLYLVEHIKDRYRINLNKDYANAFCITGLCSLSYSETMVKEIKMLERNTIIEIDIKTKELKIKDIDYEENTIEPDSKEGMEIIDKWHDKWIRIIRRLNAEKKSLIMELTGGYDSRINFGLVKDSNIKRKEIVIQSKVTDILMNDYRCAKEITEKYGYEINAEDKCAKPKYNYSIKDIIEMILYSQGGRHNLVYPDYNRKDEYILTGYCGECVREYWGLSEEECIEASHFNRDYEGIITEKTIKTFYKSRDKILKQSFKEIRNKYKKYGRKIAERDISHTLYKEVRARNHFGGIITKCYQGGIVRLAPLSDKDLYKLRLYNKKCQDKNLFMAIFYTRYNNEDLLKIAFTDNKKIDRATIEYAKEINKKYPYNGENFIGKEEAKEEIMSETKDEAKKEIKEVSEEEFSKYMKNIYKDEGNKKIFYSEYNEEIWKYIGRNIEKNVRHPLQNILTYYSICEVIKYCKESKRNNILRRLIRKGK